ncbi:hypothetical protein AHAS_Ahas13G0404600 [Arachis hypogaea]
MAQAPASAPSPQAPDCCDSTLYDITRILEKEKTFIVLTMLLKITEIMKSINKELIAAKSSNGLTILAADDNAFSEDKAFAIPHPTRVCFKLIRLWFSEQLCGNNDREYEDGLPNNFDICEKEIQYGHTLNFQTQYRNEAKFHVLHERDPHKLLACPVTEGKGATGKQESNPSQQHIDGTPSLSNIYIIHPFLFIINAMRVPHPVKNSSFQTGYAIITTNNTLLPNPFHSVFCHASQ